MGEYKRTMRHEPKIHQITRLADRARFKKLLFLEAQNKVICKALRDEHGAAIFMFAAVRSPVNATPAELVELNKLPKLAKIHFGTSTNRALMWICGSVATAEKATVRNKLKIKSLASGFIKRNCRRYCIKAQRRQSFSEF